MTVLPVIVSVFGKLRRVRMRVAPMTDDDRDRKPMGFRNLFDGLPMRPVIGELEDLALAVFTQCFDPDRICVRARKTETRRHAGFENR
jgi:hypothetical protein